MCEGTDWEPSVTAEVMRRARKAHRCAECRRLIPIGTSYWRCSSLSDGHWGDWPACMKCHAVERAHAAAERSMNGSASYYVGQLLETVRECIREEPHYVVAFRAAWKGEPVPRKPPPPDKRHYSTVMG